MPSTYTTNNGIELIATGEQSGTWGDTTNTNLELLDASLDGQVTVTLSATGSSGSPNDLPVTNGAASNGRNRLVIFNDGGDLGGTAYVRLTPNDAEKIIFIRNALTASRSILVFQGTYSASNDYEIPNGTTGVLYFNGAGSGAVAANVFNNAVFDGVSVDTISEKTSGSGVTIDTVLLKDDVVNATDVETTRISANDGTTAINIANSTGAVDIDTSLNVDGTVTDDGATHDGDVTFTGASANVVWDKSDNSLEFADNAKATFGTGGDLSIYHNGSHSFIRDLGTGNFYLDSDGTALYLRVASTETALAAESDGPVRLYYDDVQKFVTTSAGIDVTGTVTMDGGATSADFSFGDSDKALFGAGNDLQIYHDGSNSYILENGTGNLIVKGNAGIYLRGTNDENMATLLQDGAVTLYHDNTARIATTSAGVDVTGTVTDDGAVHDGDVTFTGASYNVVWDKSDNSLEFADNAKAIFGAGNDLQIYHDGSTSWVKDAGIGSLYLDTQGTGIYLLSDGSVTTGRMGVFLKDGAAKLYYDNAEKLATTSSGVDVTGAVNPSTGITLADNVNLTLGTGSDTTIDFDGSNLAIRQANDAQDTYFYDSSGNARLRLDTDQGDLYIYNYDTGTDGPNLILVHDTSSPADHDTVGRVYFRGLNTADETTYYARIYSTSADVTDGSEDGTIVLAALTDGSNKTYITANDNSSKAVKLRYDDTVHLETTSAGVTVTGATKSTTGFRSDDSVWTYFGSSNDAGINFDGSSLVTRMLVADTNNFVWQDTGGNQRLTLDTDQGDLILYSYDTGTDGPNLILRKSSTSPADDDTLGRVLYQGENSADEFINFVYLTGTSADVTDGNEDGSLFIQAYTAGTNKNYIVVNSSGEKAVRLYYDGSQKLITDSAGINVTGGVGVGAAPASGTQLYISHATQPTIRLQDSGGTNQYGQMYHNSGSTYFSSRNASSHGQFYWATYNGTDVVNRMALSASGELTKANQPAFQVLPSSDQSNIPIDTWTTVVFGTERFDVASNFASNTFTAPVTGKYILSANVRFQSIDADASYYYLAIVTSNEWYLNLFSTPDDLSYLHKGFNVVADMDASDTATVQVYQSGGAAQMDIDVESWFSGYLLG